MSGIPIIFPDPNLSDEENSHVSANANIIQRLVASLNTKCGFRFVSPKITDANFPTPNEPSLVGMEIEHIPGSLGEILENLRRRGRRAANASEGLLFGRENPEALTSSIWCLGQIWYQKEEGKKWVVVLEENVDGSKVAHLYSTQFDPRFLVFSTLSFPFVR